MIGSLRGVVLERSTTGDVLLEVGGVGYRLSVPASSLPAIGELGAPTFLHVHTHVREDAIVLYGFASRDERQCFELLLGAHGVGPALALGILSALSPVALRRAVATDDADALCAISGVGKKTAARLLLELKARLGDLDDLPDSNLVTVNGNGHAAVTPRAEARAALAGLGYGVDEVRDVLRDQPDDAPVEDMLRAALKQLAGSR